MHEIINSYSHKWPDVIEWLTKELNSLRSNRASAHLVEDIAVKVYGVPTPVKQLASISIPEPRQLLIEPWDKNSIAEIESGLSAHESSFSVSNDGSVIRISLPPMSEETRKQTVTLLHKKLEEARVSFRKIREDIMKEAKQAKESGNISEDEFFQIQKDVQTVIDEYNAKVKSQGDAKEQEIMTV